ncbi:uncharacterized protein SCHCODRAFT_02607727 [Schizophyllum commune H4-8]|uniref:uncharacterized protein n=1 Tax=Schizophyllum commune (strain H4-8 / FGSC 9210) TaxID=578458 RepID=UPI00215E1D5A|nr:uncharacterized protein SCHCODRAFT_02607727 [Schizophyllum commune H4-8]KAI5900369.1 hypothetical protein SCHCODRAFT_02607727 [Schizophyllum commune H4-8]
MSSDSCTGRCLCGAVQYVVHRDINDNIHAAHCHCNMCRLWTGSICLTAVCFPASAVFFLVDSTEIPYHNPPPALKSYTSSPGVIRQFCGSCGSSMFYHDEKEGRDGPNGKEGLDEKEGLVHVSAGTLKELKDVKIKSQLFCENLIPGMEVGPTGEGVEMFRTREGKWEAGEESRKKG